MPSIRRHVRIGAGGTVRLQDDALPAGAEAEVVVVVSGESPGARTPDDEAPPLTSLLGAARGVFPTPDAAEAFVRAQRDEWD